MVPIDDVDAETALVGHADWIGPELVDALSRHPRDCVGTEYPHFCRSVEGPDDADPPAERHPVFYGCFDWHSAVHSHWSLVRQLRLFDDHPAADEVVASVDERFTREAVEAEATHLEANPSFERPYGWGWLLRLAAELHGWDDPGADRWHDALAPLEATVVDLVRREFLTGDRPFRVGGHNNSAFALACILDYARTVDDDALADEAAATAREFYGDDRDYPVEYEPLGWDFLSPALVEADLLRRMLPPDEFASWADGFFPDLTAAPYDSILEPVAVEPDPDEGVALHLVGLNLSKAWCLAGVAEALPDHPYGPLFESSAARHVTAGLPAAFTDDYAGAHWLSSFVLYLLTRNEGVIAPGSP